MRIRESLERCSDKLQKFLDDAVEEKKIRRKRAEELNTFYAREEREVSVCAKRVCRRMCVPAALQTGCSQGTLWCLPRSPGTDNDIYGQ